MMSRSRVVLAAVMVAGSLSGCGSAQLSVATESSATPELPKNASFSSSDLQSVVPPDESGRLGTDNISVGILDDMKVLDCPGVSKWLKAPIPDVSGYTTTCGVISVGSELPDRKGHVDPNGEPLTYTVQVEYAPVGLDLRSMSSTEAFNRGLVDVSLRYDSQSWNGISTEPKDPVSNPGDLTNGGYVYGKINNRLAMVQRTTVSNSRLRTTVPIDGDIFTVVINGNLIPLDSVTFAAKLPLS